MPTKSSTRISVSSIMMLVIAAIAGAATLFVPAPAVGHPGHPHKIFGTVTMAAADHVMVKTREGEALTIGITPETKILRGKVPATAADLTAGTRVVLTVVTAKGQTTAREIRLGAADPKGPAGTGASPRGAGAAAAGAGRPAPSPSH